MQGEAAIRRGLTHFLKNISVFIADWFFPSACFYCGGAAGDDGHYCEKCWAEIPEVTFNECPFCFIENHSAGCSCLDFRKLGAASVYSGWYFAEPLRSIIHQIKYNGQRRLGKSAGKKLALKIRSALTDGIDFVVPMPIHHTRMRMRGYNQAEQIATGFCEELSLPLKKQYLKRVISRTSQTRYSRAERDKNIRGSFLVPNKYTSEIKNKDVILLDDVMTTGATLSECCRVLKQAGAGSVYAVTLARVLPHVPED